MIPLLSLSLSLSLSVVEYYNLVYCLVGLWRMEWGLGSVVDKEEKSLLIERRYIPSM